MTACSWNGCRRRSKVHARLIASEADPGRRLRISEVGDDAGRQGLHPLAFDDDRAGRGEDHRQEGLSRPGQVFFTDLARVYAEEVADLAQAGCTYLQLDDTFLAFLCDEKIGAAFGRSNEDTKKMARISARLINDSIKNRPSDMAVLYPSVPRQLSELVAQRGRLRSDRRDSARRDRGGRLFP